MLAFEQKHQRAKALKTFPGVGAVSLLFFSTIRPFSSIRGDFYFCESAAGGLLRSGRELILKIIPDFYTTAFPMLMPCKAVTYSFIEYAGMQFLVPVPGIHTESNFKIFNTV